MCIQKYFKVKMLNYENKLNYLPMENWKTKNNLNSSEKIAELLNLTSMSYCYCVFSILNICIMYIQYVRTYPYIKNALIIIHMYILQIIFNSVPAPVTIYNFS